MLNINERWFCALRGVIVLGFLNPVPFYMCTVIRHKWDEVKAFMRAYLAKLCDDMLDNRPFLSIHVNTPHVLRKNTHLQIVLKNTG
jgi:hypothetical protein